MGAWSGVEGTSPRPDSREDGNSIKEFVYFRAIVRCPYCCSPMSAARRSKRPADFDSDDDESIIPDLCSESSGDEAARMVRGAAAAFDEMSGGEDSDGA